MYTYTTYHTYVLEIENFEKTEKKLVRETKLKISLVTAPRLWRNFQNYFLWFDAKNLLEIS